MREEKYDISGDALRGVQRVGGAGNPQIARRGAQRREPDHGDDGPSATTRAR